MSLPTEQIKQLVKETDSNLDIILDRRIYELGLETLRLYMKNCDEEEVLTNNLLTLIEGYSRRVDIKVLTLEIIKDQLDSNNPSFNFTEFEDNFYTNRKTLETIKNTTTLENTKAFLQELSDFYLTAIDLEQEEEEK